MRRAFIAACVLVLSGDPLLAQKPTLILYGARIFTGDSLKPWAEAIAVRGDRVAAVGTTLEIRALAGPETQSIDAEGRTIVPGFNDAHVHIGGVPWTTVVAAGTAVPPDPPRAEILAAIAGAAERMSPGRAIEVIVGPRALDDTTLRRAALDSVAPQHRVILSVWSGHGVILNSALLKSFGYDTLTNVPLGGFIERDGSGRPTGLVHEYAWWSVSARSEASQPIAALRAAHERYAMEALRMGITSVQQMSSLDPEIALLVACGAETPLRVRLIAMPMTTARGRTGTTFSLRACPPGSAGQVTVSGTKYVLDGTPVERFAFERLPYADRPNERGHLNFPPDSLAVFLRESLDRRDQLVLHAVGDSTISLVLETMRRVAPDSVWRAMRVRIEHGDGLPPDRFKQARELGIVFVQNGTHLAIAPLVAQRYSAGRRARLQPLASLRREGIPFALGSDGAPHPFLDIMLATMHPDNPMEALSREDAVRAYTRGSAFAEGAEQEKGGLGVGMLADLAMLSQDIFTIEPRALPSTVSVLTVVGGKVAYDGRRPPASTLPRVRGDG